MFARIFRHIDQRKTQQTSKVRSDQRKNSAGGFVFAIDRWSQLERFLILGSEGGSYYATERQLTRENAGCVLDCLNADGLRTVNTIVEVSDAGRAPKNDPAIFALALASASSNATVRKAALASLPKVCRTGTQLFQFADGVTSVRRWGRGLRRAVGAWYTELPPDRLAFQVAKYRQREGWSHRDLLRLSHPKMSSPAHHAVVRWVVQGASGVEDSQHLPALLSAFDELQQEENKNNVVALIRAHGFGHEMVPSKWKNEKEVWEALLEHMPIGALVRNLGKLTEVGLLAPLGTATHQVTAKLTDTGRLRTGRMHPLQLLAAQKVYEKGHGVRGSLVWKPVAEIVDALEHAFYASFEGLKATGKRHMLALDVSGSMTWSNIAGMPGISPRLGSAAMAMVTARVENRSHFVGFSHELVPIGLRRSQTLAQVISTIESTPMGSTDCALPMLHARKHKLPVDVFVVYTDNETWFGSTHPFEALRQYREALGIDAKLIVVGMTATSFSIADPRDRGMLDVVGFDLAAPAVMSDFASNAGG